MNQQFPHVAIIILNWNGLKDTLECLESVFKNNYPNYTVYIVDNASTEDELAAIREHGKRGKDAKYIFVQNSGNLGFSEGNNVGIRKALDDGAEYIFTLNNDTVVDPNFLTAAVEAALGTDSGIVATTMVNYYHRTKLDNTGHLLLSTGDTVPRSRNENWSKEIASFPRNDSLMGACAGAALYSSKMLKEIGLFDKDFFLNYEDSDLSLRAIVRGWRIVHSPTSIVYHKLNASIGKIKNSAFRIRSQRNQLWAYLHNAPLAVIIANAPWIILRDLLVLIISILTLRWTITAIIIRSRWKVLETLPMILKKRRHTQRHRKVSAWWFWTRQTSWFTTYWKYFNDIVIKRKDSVMR